MAPWCQGYEAEDDEDKAKDEADDCAMLQYKDNNTTSIMARMTNDAPAENPSPDVAQS